VRVWVPYDDFATELRALGAQADVYTGMGSDPATVDDVEILVAPYMLPGETLAVAARMPKLRIIQMLTAGYEQAMPYLPDGVTLCNARGVHDASTAELTIGLVIASLRGIDRFARAQLSQQWLHGPRPALADKTVLILGFGSVGKAIEKRLVPFETSIIRVARSARPDENVHGRDELDLLLPAADVVIVTTPLTEETAGMVDAAFLARMKDGALFVNVARGGVAVTDALVAELESGRLSAALDVTDPEPLPADHPLWRAPGTLISPHVGGNSSAFLPRAKRLIVSQVRRFIAGEQVENVVAGPRWPH
jgi:phosphoglycerate dehydrogenase-like enzyme